MAAKSSSPLKILLGGLILLLFLGLVEHFIGWGNLLSPWKEIPSGTIALTIFLSFVSYWLRTVRLYDYFRTDMRGQFLLGLRLMLQHNLLNNILPMRSGEISFPVLMNRYFQVPLVRSLPALLWFRILDLHTLSLLGLLAIGHYWFSATTSNLLAALWLTIPWWLYHGQRRLHALLDPQHANRLISLSHRLLKSLPQSGRHFWSSWFWTLTNWLVKLAVFAWVLLIFVDMPVSAAWIAAISGDLTSVLPIHGIAGAGTYEAGVVAGAALFSIPIESVLPGAINLHLFILASTLIGGALSLIIPVRKTPAISNNQP